MNTTLDAIFLLGAFVALIYASVLYWRRGARDDMFLAVGIALFVFIFLADALSALD